MKVKKKELCGREYIDELDIVRFVVVVLRGKDDDDDDNNSSNTMGQIMREKNERKSTTAEIIKLKLRPGHQPHHHPQCKRIIQINTKKISNLI